MTTISQLSAYSMTALAAYGETLAPNDSGHVGKYKTAGMADAQATQFNSDWSVLEQSASDPVTGFSAVLLQRNDANGNPNPTGEKVLTIAGTNGPADVLSDLGIFLGNTVTDIQQYNALATFYTKLTRPDGKLDSAEQFTITGHSLGGYLATAFTRLFGSEAHVLHTSNGDLRSIAINSVAVCAHSTGAGGQLDIKTPRWIGLDSSAKSASRPCHYCARSYRKRSDTFGQGHLAGARQTRAEGGAPWLA